MNATLLTDIFATKGIEYLIAIGFLLVLIPFWMLLQRPGPRAALQRLGRYLVGWFNVPDGAHYHPGHAWARPIQGRTLRVGIDDFAGKLVGAPGAVALPVVGSRLQADAEGWRLQVEDKAIPMLAPLSGEVVAVNERLATSPELVAQDPYGAGWLVEVKVPSKRKALRSLVSGKAARSWMEAVNGRLQHRLSGELGMVLQDGGEPVPGFARRLEPDTWDTLAADFFHTGSNPPEPRQR